MILLAETPVKYRDGTVKTLDELGGEVSELAPDTPVKSGSTSKPLDEFIQDQIVLTPETSVVDGEDTMTLDEFVEDSIVLAPDTPVVDGTDTTTLEGFVEDIVTKDPILISSQNLPKVTSESGVVLLNNTFSIDNILTVKKFIFKIYSNYPAGYGLGYIEISAKDIYDIYNSTMTMDLSSSQINLKRAAAVAYIRVVVYANKTIEFSVYYNNNDIGTSKIEWYYEV